MGLMIHSLGELPAEAHRGYYVYLLDYGWDEPLGAVLFRNFERMADQASRNNAVVIRGVVGEHFADEVLSHHHVNGQSAEDILPAILITTKNPHEFNDTHTARTVECEQHPLVVIPLRNACETTADVATLIDRLFADIREGKHLSEFEIAKELERGKSGALANSLILRPTISGVGVDLKQMFKWFRGR